MASLREKSSSSHWWACFTDAYGKRVQRSTGTANRREAQKIADAYEAAARRKFTVAHVQRTLRELMADATSAPVPGSTLADYLRAWIDRRRVENAPATTIYYGKCARIFREWASVNLPAGGKTELALVTAAHIDAFRGYRLTRVSIATVNHEVKFLRQLFDSAKAEGLILDSPLFHLKRIKHHVPAEFRPFTADEVRKLLAAADDEWRSMILFGFYTGQRVADVARLDWKHVNLTRGEFAFTMAKTGKNMVLPLAIPLVAHLAETPVLDRLGPLHPRAFAFVSAGRVSRVSASFHRLLVAAGLLPKRPHKRSRPEGDSRHVRAELSFHNFRHTATSMLRDAGARLALRWN
ncbi:MAG: tyrosine-type recombinase/integrase [Verrucomicrobiota bacterium]